MKKELRERLQPVYFEAGATLYAAQVLEYGLKLLIFLLSHQRRVSMEYDEAERILDGNDKKTLGQLLSVLAREGVLTEAAQTSLNQAVEPRNRFVHTFLTDNAYRFLEGRERDAVIAEIRAVRRLMQQADADVRGMVTLLLKRYGLSFEDMTKSMEAVMAEALQKPAVSEVPQA